MNSFKAFSILFCVATCGRAQEGTYDRQPSEMLYQFYHQYITEGDSSPTRRSIGVQDSLLRANCTVELMDKLDADIKSGRLDWDPFVRAQDFDVNWLKTLQVKQEGATGWFVVSFLEDFTQRWTHVRLKVAYTNRRFRISEVEY